MQSKNALSNLKNRYMAVLKKCNLINTFGTLALATMCVMPLSAFSATNPAATTIAGMDATDGTEQANLPHVNYYNTNKLTNEGIIQDGIEYVEPFKNMGANALVGMFGNSSEDYTFSNTGEINIENTAIKGFVFGMYAEATASTLNNSSNITINTTDKYAKAYGLYSHGTEMNTLSNSGVIEVFTLEEGSIAHGMYAEGDGVNTINNTNQIKVTASGNPPSDPSAAYGILVDSDGTATVQNDGIIDITSLNSVAKGVYFTGGLPTGTHTLINTNKIIATGYNSTYGIHSYAADTASLINDGIIEVSSSNGSGSIGMYTENTITSNTLINRNTIIVKNTGDTSDDYAYGMRAVGGNVTVANYGTIEATVDGEGKAVGMITNTRYANSLNNYGTIKATATGDGMAVGIASTSGGAYTFNNYGIIELTSGTGSAFEAYAFQGFGSTGKYSVGTWATTLQDWTVNNAVFGYSVGGAIDLSSATIILRPKEVGDSFEFGVNYDFEHFIVSNNANVDFLLSDIGTITTEVPFFKAVITGTSTANATVRMESNINDETTPGSITSSALLKTVQLQAGNASKELTQASYEDIYAKLLAQNGLSGMAAGSEVANTSSKWQIFLKPYASSMDNRHYNYDGDAKGIMLGASYNVSDKFSFGGHFDFNSSKFDSTLMNLDSELSSYALGLHATYKIMPQWYIIGQATGALSEMENDYDLVNGILASTASSYDSKALYLALNTGYVWDVASNENSMHSLTPEIGVNYLNIQSDDYALDWGSAYSIYNMNYNDSNYSAFYAAAKLNWRSEWFMSENNTIALLAGVGLRQKLTGDDFENDFHLLGYDYTTQASEDDSTFLANLGFEVNKNNHTLRFNYNAEFGSEQEVHSGNVMWTYKF